MPNIWALHHDERYWPEPEKFDPDRFIGEDGKLKFNKDSFLPFSTGRRVCVGEALAKSELTLLLAMMFQKFTFLAPPGETVDTSLQQIPWVCIPNKYNVIVKERV